MARGAAFILASRMLTVCTGPATSFAWAQLCRIWQWPCWQLPACPGGRYCAGSAFWLMAPSSEASWWVFAVREGLAG